MEYSSLEEAFPNVEKKKSKRIKKLPLSYTEESADVDPDRQGCRPMPYVDAFQDISAAVIKVPASQVKVPDYFGKGVDTEEGFANYSNVIGDDPTYRLTPDFASQFLGVGLEKPAGSPPAEPNLDMAWKPLTDGGVPTASFNVADVSGPELRGPKVLGPKVLGPEHVSAEVRSQNSGNEDLHRKIDELYRRIAELDRQKHVGPNAQTEVLMFVSSGLALILLLHALTAGRR